MITPLSCHRSHLLAAATFALFLCSCAATKRVTPPALPPVVAFNDVAHGRKPMVVMLAFADGAEFPFLIDTGSGATLIDSSLRNRLGQKLGESNVDWAFYDKAPADVYPAPGLFLGGTRLVTGERVLCADLSHDEQPDSIKGILGYDCLKHYCVQLDFQAQRLRFLDPERSNVSELGTPYRLVRFANAAFVTTELPGVGRQRLRIDTGMSGTDFMLKPSTFNRLVRSLETSKTFEWKVEGTSDEPPGRNLFCKLEGGGKPYRSNVRVGEMVQDDGRKLEYAFLERAFIGDRMHPGVQFANAPSQSWLKFNWMGLDFFARHLVTFDLPNGVMYLKELPRPSANR